jgi:hypothetical protein
VEFIIDCVTGTVRSLLGVALGDRQAHLAKELGDSERMVVPWQLKSDLQVLL